jgi:ubiquinone/menaquinone biosynthesis C-methylase UbiE
MEPHTPNFDSLARAYRWMEYFSFGPMLERCRDRFLSQCTEARHCLMLGDGDGRFTARLLSENPTVQIDAVDASAAMLQVLRERARRSCPEADIRLRTVQADIRQFVPIGKNYDLVVSHFFLDCLTNNEVAALIERLSPFMTGNARWLLSEFHIPAKGWQRMTARILVWSLYFAFSVLTGLRVRHIPNFAEALGDYEFQPLEKAQYLGGLLVAELWERRVL